MNSFFGPTLRMCTHLFVKVQYLDHETAKPFRSSSQAPPVTTSLNHSKVEVISLSALPKDTISELAGLSSH